MIQCFLHLDSKVTKAWGYFLWGGKTLYISTHGQEGVSPHPTFTVTSGSWYKLKTEVSGTNVKIYINDKLVKEITVSGSGADAKSNNYVGIWCHYNMNTKGDSFQGKILSEKESRGFKKIPLCD